NVTGVQTCALPIYQLPFGPDKPFASGKSAASYLLRDWEIGGIAVMQSGLPFTVSYSGSPSNTGAGTRASPVQGVDPYPQHQTIADRKSTRLNSSHVSISYAVFCLKKKRTQQLITQQTPHL